MIGAEEMTDLITWFGLLHIHVFERGFKPHSKPWKMSCNAIDVDFLFPHKYRLDVSNRERGAAEKIFCFPAQPLDPASVAGGGLSWFNLRETLPFQRLLVRLAWRMNSPVSAIVGMNSPVSALHRDCWRGVNRGAGGPNRELLRRMVSLTPSEVFKWVVLLAASPDAVRLGTRTEQAEMTPPLEVVRGRAPFLSPATRMSRTQSQSQNRGNFSPPERTPEEQVQVEGSSSSSSSKWSGVGPRPHRRAFPPWGANSWSPQPREEISAGVHHNSAVHVVAELLEARNQLKYVDTTSDDFYSSCTTPLALSLVERAIFSPPASAYSRVVHDPNNATPLTGWGMVQRARNLLDGIIASEDLHRSCSSFGPPSDSPSSQDQTPIEDFEEFSGRGLPGCWRRTSDIKKKRLALLQPFLTTGGQDGKVSELLLRGNPALVSFLFDRDECGVDAEHFSWRTIFDSIALLEPAILRFERDGDVRPLKILTMRTHSIAAALRDLWQRVMTDGGAHRIFAMRLGWVDAFLQLPSLTVEAQAWTRGPPSGPGRAPRTWAPRHQHQESSEKLAIRFSVMSFSVGKARVVLDLEDVHPGSSLLDVLLQSDTRTRMEPGENPSAETDVHPLPVYAILYPQLWETIERRRGTIHHLVRLNTGVDAGVSGTDDPEWLAKWLRPLIASKLVVMKRAEVELVAGGRGPVWQPVAIDVDTVMLMQ